MNSKVGLLLDFLNGKIKQNSLSLENWQNLIDQGRKHQLLPVLYYELKERQIPAPAEILNALKISYLQNGAHNMRIYSKIKIVLERLHWMHIPVIPLKGLFLAQHVYGNFALRSMSDADLLVKEEDVPSAGRLLLNLGFRPLCGLEEAIPEEYAIGYFHPEWKVCAELHWNIINKPFGTAPDMDGIWSRAQSCQIENVPSLCMCPEDFLLSLSVHSSKHVFDHGLRLLFDIKQSLLYYRRNIRWNLLLDFARKWKATRSLYVNLYLTRKFFCAPMQETFPDDLGSKELDNRMLVLAESCALKDMSEQYCGLPQMDGLVQLWKEKSLLGKFARVWKNVFPNRKFLATRYAVSPSSWSVYLYYPRRIWDLLFRYGKTAVSLLTGNDRVRARAERQNQLFMLRHWLLSV